MKKKIFLVLIFIFFQVGCNKTLQNFVGGTYDGFLIEYDHQFSQQSLITAQLNKTDARHFTLTVQKPDQSIALKLKVSVGSKTIEIAESGGGEMAESGGSGSFVVSPLNGECYASKDSSRAARFCYSEKEVSLDLQYGQNGRKITLVVNPRSLSQTKKFETPQSFTKNQLIDRAINQSYTTRLDFEHVVQAKSTATVSTMNLLPHVNINTVLNMLSLNYAGALKALGDLAPFVLPNRWFSAGRDRSLYQAQFDGWITTKTDSGNIVEGLAYIIMSSKQSLEKLKSNLEAITDVRDQIRGREKDGIIQLGSSDDITAVIDNLDLSLSTINELIKNQTVALAQASGFMNPDGIKNLIVTQEPISIENPEPIDIDLLNRLALERSYEIRQMDFLIKAAQSDEKGRAFNFLDPNADATGSIGFGYPAFLEIGRSKVRELMTHREELQSIIQSQVKQAVNDANEAVEIRRLALAGYDTQQRRIDRITSNMRLGLNYFLADLVTALQGRVTYDLQLVDAKYKYLNAWSKLNRLTLSGPYSGFVRGQTLLNTFEKETGINSATGSP